MSSHTDYVRSAMFDPSSPHLIVSGSYDSTFRVHDIRLPPETSNTMIMRHGGSPIEDILAFPAGGVGLSVGGPILRVWDLNIGQCLRAVSNHQKTVTCAAFDGSRSRVLTGGLDMMVKVYDVEDWKVVHTMRYPAPILSLAVSVGLMFLIWTGADVYKPDDTHIAAGMTDGTLSVRRRDPKPSEAAEEDAKQAALAGGSYEYFADMEAVFGRGYVKPRRSELPPVIGPADEFRVEGRRREKLRDFEKFLKAFKYSAALDAALKKVSRFTKKSVLC